MPDPKWSGDERYKSANVPPRSMAILMPFVEADGMMDGLIENDPTHRPKEMDQNGTIRTHSLKPKGYVIS